MRQARLGATVVKLDTSRPFNAARARNEGFATLTAQNRNIRFVQFVDGDCELDGNWLATAVPFLSGRNDVGVVCGRRRERHPEKSVYNALCDLEWDTPIGEAAACGGDSLVRADAFKAVGGFDARLIAGEEPELCARLRQAGWKIWRLDAEMTCHDAAMTRFGQWWKRAVRSGYGYAQGAEFTSRRSRHLANERSCAHFSGALHFPSPLSLVRSCTRSCSRPRSFIPSRSRELLYSVGRRSARSGSMHCSSRSLSSPKLKGSLSRPWSVARPHGHPDRVQGRRMTAGFFRTIE